MFIQHNLLSDQFFTDIDLIACRGTLHNFKTVHLVLLHSLINLLMLLYTELVAKYTCAVFKMPPSRRIFMDVTRVHTILDTFGMFLVTSLLTFGRDANPSQLFARVKVPKIAGSQIPKFLHPCMYKLASEASEVSTFIQIGDSNKFNNMVRRYQAEMALPAN